MLSICAASATVRPTGTNGAVPYAATGKINEFGGVAQLVRAHGSYPWCRWFKSTRRYHDFEQMPLRMDYRGASSERLDSSRELLGLANFTTSIYLSGLAAESMLRSFIVSKDGTIKRHNLRALAEEANMSRRLNQQMRERVDAAIVELSSLWRNLYRYSTAQDMDRMAKETNLRLDVGGVLVRYTELGSDPQKVWAERVYNLASLVVQEGERVWASKER